MFISNCDSVNVKCQDSKISHLQIFRGDQFPWIASINNLYFLIYCKQFCLFWIYLNFSITMIIKANHNSKISISLDDIVTWTVSEHCRRYLFKRVYLFWNEWKGLTEWGPFGSMFVRIIFGMCVCVLLDSYQHKSTCWLLSRGQNFIYLQSHGCLVILGKGKR